MPAFPRGGLTRREWLHLTAAGVTGLSLSGWMERLAATAGTDPRRRRSCILLWMNGGPSQLDTFDLKPGHSHGGPFRGIQTSVAGIRISEHLPRIARHMDRMAIVRSMSTREADHGRATYLMRTGRLPGTPIHYPSLGALVAREQEIPAAELPSFVSIAPFRLHSPEAFGPGFLGPQYAPMIVGENENISGPVRGQHPDQLLRVQNLNPAPGITPQRALGRTRLLDDMEQDFLAERPVEPALRRRTAYQRALRLMRSAASTAFHLDQEPRTLREAYGMNLFGQGCLLARRLVERGVPFIEVTLSSVDGVPVIGWDTHQNNFNIVQRLSLVLDLAWSTLMRDLQARGLLDSTLIVWMGEFGRSPAINSDAGRDHWAQSWSMALAGGGIRGGQAIGRTNPAGTAVVDRPVSVPDLLATVCLALGIDPTRQNLSNLGRPIRIVEPNAQPIRELIA
jgi:hypothetical protein